MSQNKNSQTPLVKTPRPLVIPLPPFSSLTKCQYRMEQISNKSKFFEGQLDPLTKQNQSLKTQLAQFNRIIISSTEMLRNLLPKPINPEKRLQLQMANLEGISTLIKLDWLEMKRQIAEYEQEVRQNKLRIQQLEHRYKITVEQHNTYLQNLANEHKGEVSALQNKLSLLQLRLQQTVAQSKAKLVQVHNGYKQRQKQFEQLKSKHSRYVEQSKARQNQLLAISASLKQQIALNISMFEENRRMLIENNMTILAEKQEQLRKQYEYVLKLREQEYMNTIKELQVEITGMSNKILGKQEQILQLYQTANKYISEKQILAKEYNLVQVQLLKCKEQNGRHLHQIQNKAKEAMLLEERIKVLEIKYTTVEAREKEKSSKLQQLSKQMQELKEQHLQQLESGRIERQHIAIERQKLRQEVSQKQRLVARLEKDAEESRVEIKNLYKFKQLNGQLQEQVKSNRNQVLLLEKQKTYNLSIIANKQLQLQDMQQAFNQKMLQAEGQHKARYKQLEHYNRQRLEQLAEQHRQLVQNLETQNKKKYENIEQYISQKQKEHVDNLKKAQQQLQQKSESYTQLEGRLEGLKQEAQEKQRQAQNRITKILNQKELQLKDSVMKFRRQIEDLSQTLEQNKEKHQQQLLSRHRQFQKQIKENQEMLKKQARLKEQQYNRNIQKRQEQYREERRKEELQQRKLLEQKQREANRRLQQRQRQFKSKMEVLQNSINILKSSNGIMQMEDKFNKMIEGINTKYTKQLQDLKAIQQREKEQMKIKYEDLLKDNLNKYDQQLTSTKSKYQSTIREKQIKFNGFLHEISVKLEQNIVQLNQELFSQKEAHSFTKLTQSQKIVYLSQKIQLIKSTLEAKEQRVQQLQQSLAQKMKELQRVDLLVIEKMRKKKEEYDLYASEVIRGCEEKISKKTAACNEIIRQMQIERLNFAESLYKEFEQIKQRFEKQLQASERKYKQLEQLFEERPSREEDIKRIKQLSVIQQQMEMEVDNFKRKINSANDIVRYLNLQLENYKDVYDIFGPESVDKVVLDSKKEEVNAEFRLNMKNLLKLTKPKKNSPYNLLSYSQSRQPINAIHSMKQRNKKYSTVESDERYIKFVTESNLEQIEKISEEEDEDRHKTIKTQNRLDFAQNNVRQYRRRRKVQKSKSFLQKYGSKQKQKLQQKPPLYPTESKKDKSQQFKANAEMFLSLINSQKPVTQIRKNNQGYGRATIKKRAQSKLQKIQRTGSRDTYGQKEKKYKIKDKILLLDNY